ncbi:GRIP and coiled-coil domain-containing protein 2-like [Montipora foliosa]|uniref:GRIP and coiled-coil domain-containing protein 2-like n=1 Tax=Montipora foliosa TaxID=591990 RepID=UPI0035F1A097
MFGKPRSSIPVPGSQTGIPVRRTEDKNGSTVRSTQGGANSRIPVSSKSNGRNNSTSELPKDPKILSEMVLNLQKQIQEKDDAFREMSEKLSRKSEECESLLEERDIMRSKNSFALQQITEDQDALQETLKKKDRYIQEMEGRDKQEIRELKNELDELNSEHEIEMEMLRKEMEDLKLREERWKRAAELKKESDYDSSDVGSRDHSPEVEALKEKIATIHSNYEDEISVLKEKLQTHIIKAKEATEKMENQDFEFQESLSELKSEFEREKNDLILAHRAEIDALRSESAEGLQIGGYSSTELDNSQKEHYENLINQLEEQVTNLNTQLEERNSQMAQDLMTVKGEYEAQLEEARSGFEIEKENLQKTILELTNPVEEMNAEHSKDIEQMGQAFTRVKEESVNRKEEENIETMQTKVLEYESEIKELKETLLNERSEFIESRELLESTIADLEKDFEEKEEKLKEELHEDNERKIEKVVSDYEQRLQDAERRHLDGKNLDDEKRTIEELHLEIKTMERAHEREIDKLNENMDSLQAENENLRREFDLVVSDLSSELETTKKNENLSLQTRKTPSLLREQIEIIKASQEEQIRQLGQHIELYKQRVGELESEIERLRGMEEKKDGHMDLQTKTVELEYELDVLREESQNKEEEIEEYKKKVSELERDLAQRKRVQEQDFEEAETQKHEISVLQVQLDSAVKEKENFAAQAEEQKVNNGSLRKELGELNDTKQRLELENMKYSAQLQMLSEDYKSAESKLASMQETIQHLEAENLSLQDTTEKTSQESKIKIQDLTENIEKMVQEKNRDIDAQKEKSDEIISGLNNNIENLLKDNETIKAEKDGLLKEVKELRQTTKEDETHHTTLQYEEKIRELSEKIRSLEDYQRQSEIEKDDLREDIEELRYSQEVEAIVSVAEIDENFASNPATSELEYEQQMKGLAEDYEEKLEKLQAELANERNKYASSNRRLESITLENENFRENLEEERLSVKNAQERMVDMQKRYDEEVKSLKEQLQQIEKKNNSAKVSFEKEVAKDEFSKTITTLEADLETALQTNNEQAEEIASLKAQLEKAWHTNETLEREITQTNREAEELRLQHKQQDGNSTAEHVMARDVHAKTIQVLKADLESARIRNQSQQEEISKLRQELEDFQRQQIAHEANLTAEHLKSSEQHSRRVEALQADLEASRQLNKTLEEEIQKLQRELEDFQQQKIALEGNRTAEQIQVREIQKINETELERKTNEITSLKSKLETAQETNRMQSQELLKTKHERDELQKSRQLHEKDLATEQMKADEAMTRRIKELEEELKRKTEEMTKLFGVLDTEQKGRERVLLETEKRLNQMHRAEQDKINTERILTELRNKNTELRGELIMEKEKFETFVSQYEKAQLEEHAEVEKLSRSLTESEMGKEKLTEEIDTCREELNKIVEKYNKLKERFLALKQKRKEEKEKYDEIFHTPRIEMGLQTSLLELGDLNETKEQLSSSMREQVRLEDELEVLQRDMYKKTTEIQALKRANNVLRKQNQVLYLETENLRSLGHMDEEGVTRIQKFNQKLLQDKENLEIENRFLKEALSDSEKQDQESLEKDTLSGNLMESELGELKEKHGKVELENAKLKEENEFLVRQGKRLQAQVDRLEEENGMLRNRTPSTPPRHGNYDQSQVLVDEVIQNETEVQLNMESSPPHSGSVGEQRFAAEKQRIREQLLVLQGRLRTKESELQETGTRTRTEEVDDLVNEREALAAQIHSLQEALEKYQDKESTEIVSQQIPDLDADRKVHTTDGSSSFAPFTPTITQMPFTGFQISNLQQFEFSVDNYLGSAYWEASKFLDRLQQVN